MRSAISHRAVSFHENRHRYYDPYTGTYLQVDPKVEDTWEAYNYVEQNPVMHTDPWGNEPIAPDDPLKRFEMTLTRVEVIVGEIYWCFVDFANSSQTEDTLWDCLTGREHGGSFEPAEEPPVFWPVPPGYGAFGSLA